jgi:hypothetical protein
MGGKLYSLTHICNLMIVTCNQLFHMMLREDATNNFEVNTLRTVSIEYNIIPSRIQKFSNLHKLG